MNVRESRPLATCAVAAAFVLTCLSATTAQATSCADIARAFCCPFDLTTPDEAPLPQARDFSPWEVADEDRAAALLDAACVIRDTSAASPDVAVDVVAIPMGELDEHDLARGCESGSRFSKSLVRFSPTTALAPETRYEVRCSGVEGFRLPFATGDEAVSPPPPVIEVGDVSVIENGNCSGIPELQLEFPGLQTEFFSQGGMILVEYGPGRIDYAHTQATTLIRDGTYRIPFALPLADDDTISVRAVNGAGVAGPVTVVDVAGLGADERAPRCGVAAGAGIDARLVVMLLIFVGRRRRRA